MILKSGSSVVYRNDMNRMRDALSPIDPFADA